MITMTFTVMARYNVFSPQGITGHQSFLIRLPGGTNFTLAIDAAYTLDHYHERLSRANDVCYDVAQSVRKLRQLTERYHAVFIPGHDPEEWKKQACASLLLLNHSSLIAKKRLLAGLSAYLVRNGPGDGRGHFCGQAQGFTSSTT